MYKMKLGNNQIQMLTVHIPQWKFGKFFMKHEEGLNNEKAPMMHKCKPNASWDMAAIKNKLSRVSSTNYFLDYTYCIYYCITNWTSEIMCIKILCFEIDFCRHFFWKLVIIIIK